MSDDVRFPAELLANEDWLRAFVRRLVAEHDVDDVVQSTWAAALQRTDTSPPLLAGIARRLAAMLHRGRARRTERERAAARREAVPATDDAVARLEVLQRVAAAVCALPEPYRATVLRHHELGLGVAAIAAADGVTADVVRKRLQRGRAMVRSSLRGALGDDWRGCPALLALLAAWRPRTLPMMAGAVVAAAVPLGLVLATLGASSSPLPPSPAPRAPVLAAAQDAAAGAARAAASRTFAERTRATLAEAAPAQEPQPTATAWTLVATVRDASGAPLPRAIVRVGPEDRWTDASGTCRFDLGADRGALPDRVSARVAPGPAGGPLPLPVVLDGLRTRVPAGGGELRVELRFAAVARTIAGQVLGADGTPAANVSVFLAEAEPLDPAGWPLHPLAPVEDLATAMEGEVVLGEGRCAASLHAQTAADGTFALGGLRTRDYVLRAVDWKTRTTAVTGVVAAGRADVVLRLPARATREVHGVLRDPAGAPIADARVVALLPLMTIAGVTDHFVVGEARTRDDGAFAFAAAAQANVVAVREPAMLPVEVALPDAAGAARDALRLVTDRRHGLQLDAAFERGDRARGATTFAVLDAQERPLPLCGDAESLLPVRWSVPLHDAIARPVFTSGAAAIVRLQDDAGRVLLRLPCTLREGEIVTVR